MCESYQRTPLVRAIAASHRQLETSSQTRTTPAVASLITVCIGPRFSSAAITLAAEPLDGSQTSVRFGRLLFL